MLRAMLSRRAVAGGARACGRPVLQRARGLSSRSSEVGEVKEDKSSMSAFTGAPEGMLGERVVKIYQQSQQVCSGTQNTLGWRMQWEDGQTRRWTNPLMGWSSTSDPLSNTHMTLEFASSEDAARFCERNGWKYEVIQPKPSEAMFDSPKKYADNFYWQGPKGTAYRSFPDLYEPPPPPPPPPK